MATQSKAVSRLVDSAIVIAFVSAVCYAVGYWGELRNSRTLGFPFDLLPQPAIHATILAGAAELWLLAACAIVLWALLLFGFHVLPRGRSQMIESKMREGFGRHNAFYISLIAVITAAVIIGYPYLIPLERFSYRDEALLDVIECQLKDAELPKNCQWKFIARNDGILVLKETGKRRFVMFNENNLRLLRIVAPSSDKHTNPKTTPGK